MEGKTVILSALIMSMIMMQIQVEATEGCCPSTTARKVYNTCRFSGGFREYCAKMSGCKVSDGTTCPPGYLHDILQNSDNALYEYCKLGCSSSVCGALTTLQNSDASEVVVKNAVEQCTKACSTLCTKGVINAVKTA